MTNNSQLTTINKFNLKLLIGFFVVIVVSLLLIVGRVNAQSTASRNSSISFKKDPNNLFIITIRDPQGIKEFSLQPPGKFSYGGEISGCPTSRKIDNVVFDDPFDFTPAMGGYVVDCGGNKDELEIFPPKNGVASAVRVGAQEEPAKTEAKKEAPKTAAPTEEAPKPSAAPSAGGTTPSAAPAAKSNIQYPVAALGNCSSEFECRVYCDSPANIGKCLDYAEKNNLIKSDEIERGRKFKKVLDSGGTPGGCDSQQSCEVYCNDIDNLDKCLAFGEANGFLSGKELEEAKKVHSIVRGGGKLPGNCRNKTACEAYCKNPQHGEECLAFAESAGFLSEKELQEAKKFLPLMQRGETPGACKSKEECEVYCESEEHIDECIDFAIKHDVIPKEERERVEAFRKAGGKGPGGCRGRQCQAFCENPVNQKACFEWAKENGMLREDDLRRMEEGKQQLKNALGQMPPEARACVEEAIPGGLSAVESGEFFGGPEIGDKIRECFEQAFSQFGGPGGPGGFPGGPGGPGGFQGPGGCTSPEECQAFCQDNPEECQDFHPPTGGPGGGPGSGFPGGGGFGGPGGCKSIDECMAYCQEHLDECGGFGPPGGGMPGGQPPSQGGGFPGGGATGGQFPGGGPNGEFPGGPGGCKSQEECTAYCKDHPQDCGGGGSPGGGQGGSGFPSEPRDFRGPRNAEECVKQRGSWDGSKCNFRDSSQENIGIDRGGEECVKQGGNWDGKNCNFPQQHQQQSPRGEEFRQRLRESPIDKLREGFGAPPAGLPPSGSPSPADFQQQYQQQYQQEFQKQIEQQYQQQFQQQYQNLQPPAGSFPPSPTNVAPPTNLAPPPNQTAPPPSGSLEKPSFLARLLNLLK
ncbi:MAG: hypothetical protein HYY86_01990 [Candidatus Harrisonbacteria bacterium]|nr:hypothetical protein [Candidatus Harrisonbacteria bacterium]